MPLRRHRKAFQLVEPIIEGEPDVWPAMGDPEKRGDAGAHNLPVKINGQSQTEFIVDCLKRKGKCELLVLGPGLGRDLLWLHEDVSNRVGDESQLKQFNIDVLGLTKTIEPEVRGIVRNDYSGSKDKPVLFENYENPDLIGRYDLSIAALSVGFYTRHPNLAVVKNADMLGIGGAGVMEIGFWGDTQPKTVRYKPEKILEECNRFFRQKRPGKAFELDHQALQEAPEHESHWYQIKRIK